MGNNGKLWATEASVSGVINATSGSFNNITIGGSTWNNGNINSSSIVSPTINTPAISNGSFASGSLNRCYVPGALYMGNSGGEEYIELDPSGLTITTPKGGIFLQGNNETGVYIRGKSAVTKDAFVFGGLYVSGNKNRIIDTSGYGTLCLSAYETPSPTFADYGRGELDEGGKCHIAIDPRFRETVDMSVRCTVFLTKYGEGDIWVNEAESTNEIVAVSGTPGLKFSWETRYAQAGVDLERMEKLNTQTYQTDYEDSANEYLKEYGRRIG